MHLRMLPAALVVALLSIAASTDEGMWQPKQMPQLVEQLKGHGLQMYPADLSNLAAKVYPAPQLLKEMKLPAE